MHYIDGCVLAVPIGNKDIYKKYAEAVAIVFKEYGALKLIDCWADDVPDGEITSFPMAVKCKEDETVCFSWIVWPSKEVRNDTWPKVMADSRLSNENNPMPFDAKRMIFGGFEMIVDV
ncbi:protein of unknown function DUF1428 [Thalassoporum mexicanum PCC 7367]|uniref:DUF1428 domain-containing protein n=1 Tax=Thalassoporum mexicanum TaxID=3457544 RepID=UPI00029FAAA6|nr:DUF1428 domain-containing protein [Pseudanabaena sp. PCC 7367]AFY69517.1 protein of unknown function DUF1428 [Pseudanabaena sp. PCC 7367]